jgi:hypothetical protein
MVKAKRMLGLASLSLLLVAGMTGCKKETPIYNVQFVDWDATVLLTQTVEEGKDAEYTGATPTRANDETSQYAFIGWDASLTAVKADTVYHAMYSKTAYTPEAVIYEVTFLNYDGTVMATSKVKAGEKATYAGTTPTRTMDEAFTYTFKGWNYDLATKVITQDTTFVAQFNTQERVYTYNVTFQNWDGTAIGTAQKVQKGKKATAPTDTPTRLSDTKYDYTFSGWDKDPATTEITADTVFTAQYTKADTMVRYLVNYMVDNTVFDYTWVKYGEFAQAPAGGTPTRKADDNYTYTFIGWDVDITLTRIYSNLDIHALFEATEKTVSYTVTFYNWDGKIWDLQTVKKGETPKEPSITPTRPEDANYQYDFIGWTISLEDPIYGDTIAFAQFKAEVITRSYAVTFHNWDGTVLSYKKVTAGSKITTVPADPTRPATEGYVYQFENWDIDVDNYVVNRDVDIWAQYTSSVRIYTVRFLDFAGNMLDEKSIPYGSVVGDYDEETFGKPTRDADPDAYYQFTNWDVDAANYIVKSDFDIHPVFSRVAYDYAFTFTEIGGTYSVDKVLTENYPAITDWEVPATHLGEDVTAIGDNAFANQTSHAKAITLPETITSIGNNAFANTDITTFNIPENVDTIGANITAKCSLLTYLASESTKYQTDEKFKILIDETAPKTVVAVAPGVETIELVSGIAAVADGVLNDMPNLTTLNIYSDSLTAEGLNVAKNYDHLPMFTTVYTQVNYAGTLIAADNALYSTANASLVLIPQNRGGDYVLPAVVPDTEIAITKIEAFAAYTANLANVTLSGGLTSIGANAFQMSTLQTLTFASATVSNQALAISDYAFNNCKALTKVSSTGTNSFKYTLNTFAFKGDSALTTFNLGAAYIIIKGAEVLADCSALTNVRGMISYQADGTYQNDAALSYLYLTESFTTLTYSATFKGCTGLKEIGLGTTINNKTVTNNLFKDCTALTTVYLTSGDTLAMVSTVTFGTGNDPFKNAHFAVYSETKPTDTDTTHYYWHRDINLQPTLWTA